MVTSSLSERCGAGPGRSKACWIMADPFIVSSTMVKMVVRTVALSSIGSTLLVCLCCLQTKAYYSSHFLSPTSTKRICADVLHFLDRMLSNATFRRPLTDEVEKHIYQLLGLFAIPNAQAGQILRRLTILNIYRGNFPVIPLQWLQSIHLDSDESCYMFTSTSAS